jgi:hypothetical protein
MNPKNALSLALVGLVSCWASVISGDGRAQEPPKVKIPDAGVPQVMTMEGRFVRAAYNNEGYVILGYQLANRSVGEAWMLLEVGLTVRDSVPDYTLTRDALSLEIPGGKTIPLPSIAEHRNANTQALQTRAQVQRDSINYFPPSASRACAMAFFPDLTSRAMPRDNVELLVGPSKTAQSRRPFLRRALLVTRRRFSSFGVFGARRYGTRLAI